MEEKMKMRAQISDIEIRKTKEKNNKTKSWFFKKIKIDKTLVR